MARKKLSHDQKRKAKLAKRARREQPKLNLEYTGNKYKKEKYVPVVFATEQGIGEADVMTERQLTDHTVREALEKLALALRDGSLPPLEDTQSITVIEGNEVDLIIWRIRSHWEYLFETHPHPGKENLIGVLRTLIGSVNTWSAPGKQSRGYLHFLEGFLRKAGVHFDLLSEESEPLLEGPPDFLLELGRSWCLDGDRTAKARFLQQVEEHLRSDEAEHVVNICQRLLGEIRDPSLAPDLSAISVRAQQYL